MSEKESNTFWYSEQQKDSYRRMNYWPKLTAFEFMMGNKRETFCRLEDGCVVEYTECMPADKKSNWPDAIFCGKGTFARFGKVIK